MLANEPKIGHVQIWANYYRLAMILESGNMYTLGEFTESTVLPSDYVYKMIRYFSTGQRQFSPVALKAKDSYVGFVNTPVSSFDTTNVERKRVTVNKTLADNVVTAFRQLVARTRIDSDDDMAFLAFVSGLLVKSGTFTWRDIDKETTLESPHEIDLDGETVTAYIKTQILDATSETGESWFEIAKSFNVVSSQLS